MLYYIFRPIIRIVLRSYFRKIYYTNEQRVPNGVPKMFAINHPTSFIDPIILATHSSSVFHFILRGDVYRSPKIVQWALSSINCIPIFRKSEGFQGMRKNQSTFEYCNRLWYQGKNIQVLVEGHTKHEKRLRPIAKGPARMVLDYYDNYKDESFVIIPVGVNYTNSHSCRSQLMVDFGEPIYLKEYIEAFKENDRKAVRQITQKIQKELRKRVIHVNNPDDDKMVNQILDIHRNTRVIKLPTVDRMDEQSLLNEWNTVENINKLENAEKESLKETVNKYFEKLQNLNLKDKGVAKPNMSNFGNLLLLILGLIPFLIGALFHVLVLWFGTYLADKFAKKIEFHASIRVGGFVVGGLVYYLLWLIALLFIGNWWLIGCLFLMPIFLRFALHYGDLFRSFSQSRRFNKLSKTDQDLLLKSRKTIIKLTSFQ